MAVVWLRCKKGKCRRVFDGTLGECPDCGNADPKAMAPHRSRFSARSIDARRRGDTTGQTEVEDWLDMQNKRAIERDEELYRSGMKTLTIPKNRDRRFDPSWLNRKRLF